MPDQRLIAVAHDLRSMHNVGAIYRGAEGAGFDEVILSGYTGGPPDQRITKVALGAEVFLPHTRAVNLDDLLDQLKGIHVIVLEQAKASVTPSELVVPPGPVALVACGEILGAPGPLLDRADTILELPMRGEKESLNVSVAFGIAAYYVAAARFNEHDHLKSRIVKPASISASDAPDCASDVDPDVNQLVV